MERTLRCVPSAALTVLLACASLAFAGPECEPVRAGLRLPDDLIETSGAAVGRVDAAVIWTHNDGGSALFAVDSAGTILGSVPVRPRPRDWEDVASGACDAHGSCLYLADTGDNGERRSAGSVRILRLAEPRPPLDGGPLDADVFPIRLPDGPRDIEAVFVLPGERVHLVTKGRNHPVTVYRYPPPLRPDTVTLVEVQRLTGGAQPLASQVTGASASADGTVVAIRTYQSLAFYRVVADTLATESDGLVNLRSLRESQGEAVALGPDGLVVLTSEGGFLGAPPAMSLLRCRI